MMIGPVSAWLVWGVFVLALAGLWAVLWQAGRFGRYLRERWQGRGEQEVDWDSEREGPNLCQGCLSGAHCDGGTSFCECTCGLPEDWAELEELPPERSREELGFTGEQPVVPPEAVLASFIVGELDGHLMPERERREPAWVTEIWTAYAALGLEGTAFTRAMARQVRELAP